MLSGISLIVWALAAPGCAPASGNVVAAYLNGAERQTETDQQRQDIGRALNDLLGLSSAELRARRYPDYQGKPEAWTAAELIQKYYVPVNAMKLDEDRFYRDAGLPAGRAVLERCLKELDR